MKKLLLLFLCLYISWTGTAQNISTRISANINKREQIEEDKRPYLFDGECEQLLSLQNMTSDTVILSLENTHYLGIWVPAYTFPKLQVFVKFSQNVEYQEIDFSFDGQQLVFAIPDPNCQVKIVYFFCPFSTFLNGAYYLLEYKYDSESWFFTCSDMQIEAVAVTVPDNLYFFSNLPEVLQDNNTCHLNTTVLSDYNISLVFLLKEFYEKFSISDKLNTIDCYFSKNIDISEDYTKFSPINKDSISIVKKIHSTKTMAQKLGSFIPNTSLHINIIDGNLNRNDIAWGMAIFPVGKNEHIIIMDTSFWRKTLAHEMMHCYLPYKIQKEDSAYYLLGESMIEYLRVCLIQDKKSAHIFFKQRMKNSRRKGYSKISIFSLTDNRINSETLKGSAVVIYDKVPAVIHQFAQKIGVDNFIKMLSVFYQQVRETKEISFKTFEQSLKSQGISDKQWRWFVKRL